jgi:hypothetical protein
VISGPISPEVAGHIRPRRKRGNPMDEDEFYAAQLSAWPWLHLSE